VQTPPTARNTSDAAPTPPAGDAATADATPSPGDTGAPRARGSSASGGPAAPLAAAELRAVFDAAVPLTIGLEEEAMLLDADTLDLLPRAAEVIERAGGDPRFKPELPAAQLEINTAPARTVGEAIAALAAGRRDLAKAANGVGRLAAAAVHPFADPVGAVSKGERYEALVADHGDVARRQLVGSLQVHVAVGGADRSLAVYNALRGHLPELAAFAAAAPFHAGKDTGLASVRPSIAERLPRQGLPPELPSWDAFAAGLDEAGGVARWWWELRPHPRFGTLELRVPDTQPTLADAAAVAAFAHCLVAWLAERHDAGETPPPPPRLDEDRRDAYRHGMHGELGERVRARLEELAPTAARLGCAVELAAAREREDVATRLRALGLRDATHYLTDSYLT
jgi:carboxylate-amine ligase